MTILVILVVGFVYGYINGQHGSANIVATMISSRAMNPRLSLWLSAFGMSFGAGLLGTAVAATLSEGFLRAEAINSNVVIATLTIAVVWSGLALWAKIPVSISHSLIGGLIGAGWASLGADVIQVPGLVKVMIGLFISPILGGIGAYIVVQIIYRLSQDATPHLNRWLQRGQILASFLMALTFGSNDAQKLMGMLVMGMIAEGMLSPSSGVPLTVVLFSAIANGIGALMGGWRIIHTMGGKFYRIRPVHGFGAQMTSAAMIFVAGLLGAPVSGSQIVTASIVGAGSADRIQKVRWQVVRNILTGWFLTIPVCMAGGALFYFILARVLS